MKKYKHLFGPLMSRRFGRSLGIDLCPMKTCSYDCIFCQLGKTTIKTAERKEFFPLEDIAIEISQWLKHDGHADYITLAGSGEPILYSRFGELIDFIHAKTNIPVLLLSNGSLFWQQPVREAAAKADVVKLSLSAWNQALFEHINSPAPAISFEKMVKGEIEFSKSFKGKLIIEVFLLAGINAISNDIAKIADWTNQLKPNCIHLNTITRPVTKYFDYTVDKEKMKSFAEIFTPEAEIPKEIITSLLSNKDVVADKIINLIRRRPSTLIQLSKTFGLHPNEMAKITGKLLRNKTIFIEEFNEEQYYKPISD